MVLGERKLVSITEAVKIAKESKTTEEVVEKLQNLPKRRRSNNVPDGGISISKASRKYRISRTTIHNWITSSYIHIIQSEGKETFIPEKIISEIAKRYNRRAPRGNRQILQILSDMTSN